MFRNVNNYPRFKNILADAKRYKKIEKQEEMKDEIDVSKDNKYFKKPRPKRPPSHNEIFGK